MIYTFSKIPGQPLYLSLYHSLRQDITQGVYGWKERLPSKRVLAEEAGVSLITVEHAYELLCDEGYVEARPKSGFFVLYRQADGFAEETIPASPIPAEAPAGHQSFPFPLFARTVRTVLTDYGQQLLEKPPNTGVLALRQAIADYLAQSRGIHVGPEQIVIGAGAEYLYSLILQLLGRKTLYGIEDPSYAKIAQIYQANEARFRLLPLGRDGIVSQSLWATDATVLHITPYRSFPSGVTASASKRAEYLSWAAERQGYIIEDDFSSELNVSTKVEDTLFALSPQGRVIYLNTFSQSIAPSVRTGYMVLPPQLSAAFAQKLAFYSCTVPSLEQYTIARLITSGSFSRHINRIRRQKRQQKR